ncbi:hypothetical protein [Hanstruepera ponticola]|uniref:hypothetical protein n=1 Tax=Hanstruepera ponticola TaxID=2042995 RepID=UPI00177DB78F|nr:hypothetical protein [Hanstruepera ponticola]
MKKSTLIYMILAFCVGFFGLVAITSLIKDPKPEKCVVETKTIVGISGIASNDIVFKDSGGDNYYINRGLERGLNLDSLNAKVLNKTVTLHLAKLWLGTSEHIAQLAVGDDIIYTEFD